MIEVSQKQNIIVRSLEWHYVDAPRNIFKAWNNFLRFNFNYFSVTLLLQTFFSHWRRYKWSYGRGFDPARYLEAFFSNLVSRLLGAIMRAVLIIVGLVSEVILLIAGLIFFLSWLFMPFIMIAGLYYGIRLLF